MRAAHIIDGKVVNFVEVDSFNEEFIDPKDAVQGSLWDGEKFNTPSVKAISAEQFNAVILAQLEVVDMKSIRALREADSERISMLNAQAQALRVQLRKP